MGRKQRFQREKTIHLTERLHRRLRVQAAIRGVSMEGMLDEILSNLPPAPGEEEEREQHAA